MDKEKEIWKPINIEEVFGLYEVSSHGRIKSLSRIKHTPYGGAYWSKARIMKLSKTKNGYLNVTLSNKPFNMSFFVHVLVAKSFVKNPSRHKFVNHKNGNKQDNHYNNLEHCSRSYNILHAFRTGLIPKTRNRKTPIEIGVYLPN